MGGLVHQFITTPRHTGQLIALLLLMANTSRTWSHPADHLCTILSVCSHETLVTDLQNQAKRLKSSLELSKERHKTNLAKLEQQADLQSQLEAEIARQKKETADLARVSSLIA